MVSRDVSCADDEALGVAWVASNMLVAAFSGGFGLYEVECSREGAKVSLVRHVQMPICHFCCAVDARTILFVSGSQDHDALQLWMFDEQSCAFETVVLDACASVQFEPNNVYLRTVYGVPYCIVVDPHNGKMYLYRLCRESRCEYCSIDLLFKGPVCLSFIDHLIIVHSMTAMLSFIFDVRIGQVLENVIEFPVTAPFPVALRRPDLGAEAPHSSDTQQENELGCNDAYLDCAFRPPDLLFNESLGEIYVLKLDLRTISASISHPLKRAHFLVNRKDRHLFFQFMSQCLDSRYLELDDVTLFFNYLVSRMAERFAKPAEISPNSPQLPFDNSILPSDEGTLYAERYWTDYVDADGPPLYVERRVGDAVQIERERFFDGECDFESFEDYICQEELYACVFLPASRSSAVSPGFLTSVLCVYISSLNGYKLVASPRLIGLLIDLLVCHRKFSQLHQLVQYRSIPDVLYVALHLLHAECVYPPARQVAVGMLMRLNQLSFVFEVLLKKNKILRALELVTDAASDDRPTQSAEIGGRLSTLLERARAANDQFALRVIWDVIENGSLT
ncbi:regulator of MON1-CCZ1 complex-like isoform X2 [Schistocerca gregaria]|nr:regulator of MON1-CCZ1 complex-like isoform X2 [Schistocerca gregaria]